MVTGVVPRGSTPVAPGAPFGAIPPAALPAAPPLPARPTASAPVPPVLAPAGFAPLAPRSARLPALDGGRALAVVAMVLGHTFDALLAPSVRAEPLVAAYWMARGFTAPLFMLVSGWAVTVAVARSGARGLAVPRGRLQRVALLLALGYALRWPGWGVPLLFQGDGAVWAHFLAFDALHAIAVALLATSLVLALAGSAWRKALLLAGLAAAAVALGVSPLAAAPAALPPSLPMLALAQAAGGTSAFPLFPWVGYFFVGAILGLLAGSGGGARAAAVGAAGVALVLVGARDGLALAAGDPRLFALRAGVVLVLLAALSALPAAAAARVRPIGRASLAVYVIHLPIVYGWSTHEGLLQRIGPRLSFGAALATGIAVLGASLALRHALAALAPPALAAARAILARWPVAAGSRTLRWS
jgi:acyltransferase